MGTVVAKLRETSQHRRDHAVQGPVYIPDKQGRARPQRVPDSGSQGNYVGRSGKAPYEVIGGQAPRSRGSDHGFLLPHVLHCQSGIASM